MYVYSIWIRYVYAADRKKWYNLQVRGLARSFERVAVPSHVLILIQWERGVTGGLAQKINSKEFWDGDLFSGGKTIFPYYFVN